MTVTPWVTELIPSTSLINCHQILQNDLHIINNLWIPKRTKRRHKKYEFCFIFSGIRFPNFTSPNWRVETMKHFNLSLSLPLLGLYRWRLHKACGMGVVLSGNALVAIQVNEVSRLLSIDLLFFWGCPLPPPLLYYGYAEEARGSSRGGITYNNREALQLTHILEK